MAKYFTNNQKYGENKSYGVCLQGANGGWLYYEYCNFLYGMDGSVYNKTYGWEANPNMTLNLTSNNSINATEFYLSLKPFNAGNYFTVDQNEQINILKNENVAMGFVWSDYIFNLAYNENGEKNNKFGFAPIPGNKSALAGGCFYINKYSEHPQEAINYVINLLQPNMQVELAKKGLCSPLKSVYKDEAVKNIPYSEALLESLERGVYMFEAGPDSDLINQVLTQNIQELWRNDGNVKESLKKAENKIIADRNEIFDNL